MTTKGQKQKVYTNELKKEVMQKYYSGYETWDFRWFWTSVDIYERR